MAYLASFGSDIWALAVIWYEDVPEPRNLVDGYATKGQIETLAGLVAARVEAFAYNANRDERKVRWWRAGLVALAVGLALSAAAILVRTGTPVRHAGP